MTRYEQFERRALACAALLALTACGGSGGSDSSQGSQAGPSTPASATIAGKVVVLGPVGGATVCVDRNRNNTCDAGEPASAETGTDGAYEFSYTPSSQAEGDELAAAPLVAQVNGNNPSLPAFSKPFTMSAPSGKRAQVNPLTTLIQAGVDSGLALERAEAAVLLQLGLPETAQLYDYQNVAVVDPTRFEDNAFAAALVTADALHSGVALRVVDPTAATVAPSDQLASLTFTNPDNYFAQTYPTDGVADPSTGRRRLTDLREGKTNGAATPHDTLYPQVRLGSGGWVRCDENASFTSSLGTPSRSDFCEDSTLTMSHGASTDIAGRKMADVVAEMQAGEGNSIAGVNPAVAFADPNAVFPPGSLLTLRRGVNLSQPYSISLFDPNEKTGYSNLEALIAALPVSGVNLATGAGSASLGLIDDNVHNLRVASIDGAKAVQYYRCDFVSGVVSNCAVLATGTVEIKTAGTARVLEFIGYPDSPISTVRTYGEYAGAVYVARRTKSASQFNGYVSHRVNGVAWEAMRPQLGLGSAPIAR
ncbi:hypothetical protein [Variovorax sp.]|uniref:hypothetical protein n=1 Tax=Variovorax sp. TaxID=1871043 RepID=UPI002D5BD5AD|nr:hypothetical protein [Variovorax sp.]HYP85357.1 hypothetical protein [Variovorax sp.]